MATPKQTNGFALVTYYSQQYKKKYGVTIRVNKYKGRWGFETILEDFTMDEARSLIDYYFQTQSLNGHDLDWFFYNYEKLAVAMDKRDEDAASLAAIREETKRRTEEWRNKIRGNN